VKENAFGKNLLQFMVFSCFPSKIVLGITSLHLICGKAALDRPPTEVTLWVLEFGCHGWLMSIRCSCIREDVGNTDKQVDSRSELHLFPMNWKDL
jgi:hypothetical protein